jgi:hypothetical protein
MLLVGELRVLLERGDGDFCEEMHGGFHLAIGVGVKFPSSLLMQAVRSHIFLSL